MAKVKQIPVDMNAEITDELHPTVVAEGGVEFTDVTGKDVMPDGVADPAENDEPAAAPAAAPAAKSAAKKAPTAGDDEIPEDLKGKSPAQIAKMLKDAQTLIGRQGQELGELRRAADTYIKTALTRPQLAAQPAVAKQPEEKEPDDVDFFTNPKGAIAQAVARHPAIKALEGKSRELAATEMTRQRTESLTKFNAAHPDAKEIASDPEFRDWINKSPVRQAMIFRAHSHYDLNAGMEIFNTWKELKAARGSAQPQPAGDPAAAAPAAAPTGKPLAPKAVARVPSGGNPSPRGSQAAPGQKIYRRADVIRLMETDPHRYELMSDELTKAYQEGRVR